MLRALAAAAGRSRERAGSGLALAERQVARCRISGWHGVIRP
ncbi:hypothetical protein [Kineosporia sp. NBRC 101731]|nr:hypothetical protein [Kineosporia sp. NBRC 101731]